MEDPLYFEIQQFRQPLLWIFLIGVSIVILGSIAWAFYHKGSRPLAVSAWRHLISIGSIVLVLGLLVMFYFSSLKIRVTDDGLFAKFFPFHFGFQEIPLDGVANVEAVEYSPLGDYGGWGIRYGKKGKAYSVGGKTGVRITYADGQRRPLLLGSPNSEELAKAIRKILPQDKAPEPENPVNRGLEK